MEEVVKSLTPSQITCLNLLSGLAPTTFSIFFLSRVDSHTEGVLESDDQLFGMLNLRDGESILAYVALLGQVVGLL